MKKKRNAAGDEVYEDLELRSALEEINNIDDEEDDMAQNEDLDDGQAMADDTVINTLEDDEDTRAELTDSAGDIRQGQITIEKVGFDIFCYLLLANYIIAA